MDKALIIFLLTYVVIAIGRPPLFRIDRAGAALIGASAMIVSGVLDIDAAYRAIDYRTIVLLFSLMIVVENLRLSGLFPLVSAFVIRRISSPTLLLYAVVLMSGSLSALLINYTVCLAFMLLLFLAGALWLKLHPTERPVTTDGTDFSRECEGGAKWAVSS
jgi:Na+/H+ antiporter NhaD/arsenite permease-like protein